MVFCFLGDYPNHRLFCCAIAEWVEIMDTYPGQKEIVKRSNQKVLDNLPAITGFLSGRTQVLKASEKARQGHEHPVWYPNGLKATRKYTAKTLEADLERCRDHYRGIKQALAVGDADAGKNHVMGWQTILRNWGWVTGMMPYVYFKESYNTKARTYALLKVSWGLKKYQPPMQPQWVKELEVGAG